MKKTSLFLAALLLGSFSTSFAQGFYFRLGPGYALTSAGQTMYDTPTPYNGFPTGYNGTRNNPSPSVETYDIKGASFGSGMQGYLGLGYELSRYVAVQLDADFGLATKKYSFTDENVALAQGGGSTIPYNITTEQQAKTPILLMPSVVVQSGGDKTNLYTRFGVVLPLKTTITEDQVFANAPNTGALTVDDFTWQIKNSFSLGFTAAVGVRYKLNDRVSLWGEMSVVSLAVNAKEQDLKSWTENGQSVPLSNYSNAQQIKYSKSATVDSNLAQLPTYSQPFSNFGFNVGVSFRLSNSGYHQKSSQQDQDLIDDNKPFRRR